MNIVITGASRGIGLELCRQAQGHRILAIARDPKASEALMALNVETLALDLSSTANIADLVPQALASWPSVDLLINNAGIFRRDRTEGDFLACFKVNSIAPYFLFQSIKPWLQKGTSAKLVSVTSRMGSIEDNGSGGSYSYRASKAALNIINKSLTIDNRDWLTTLVIHPGWVQTDMGGKGATVTPDESAKGIWEVINHMTTDESGAFKDYRGNSIPW